MTAAVARCPHPLKQPDYDAPDNPLVTPTKHRIMSARLPQLTKREALGVVLVLAIGLTALASTLDIEVLADVFAIVGFVVCLPLVGILGDRLPFVAAEGEDGVEATAASDSLGEPRESDAPGEPDEPDDQVAALRERYTRGEIDEAEFERRLEALLETEDLDTAPGTSGEDVTERDRTSDRERATDRDRSTELE